MKSSRAKKTQLEAVQPVQPIAFTFGDPEPVLDNLGLDEFGTYLDLLSGNFYRPPISLSGLARIAEANANHGSTLHFKKNMIMKWYVASVELPRHEMKFLALDYVITGNGYLQRIINNLGTPVRYKRLPAVSMRRMREPNRYLMLSQDGKEIPFALGEVLHIKEPNVKQEIYGVPEYLCGIQSILLSEEATLFRRKYYINGAHMGYILVTNDANLDGETAKAIEAKVKESKGPGNFRSLYLNIPRSNSREPVKVIPVGDIGTKDEFERIKNITMREVLAMHRMQPGLSGLLPENTGGFGDVEKSMRVYHELEVGAMQQNFLEINEQAGREIVKFNDPDWKINTTA